MRKLKERIRIIPAKRPLDLCLCPGFCVLALCLASLASSAPGVETPEAFFTRVGDRLLQSELSLSLEHIEVYPTNQYTPSAHRLLQVTANLYDATTNRAETDYPYLPSVFRPLFRRDGDVIFIAGYREVTNADMASAFTAPMMIDPLDPTNRLSVPLFGTPFAAIDRDEPMLSGLPLIIGAKKGFPSFNKFALENAITVVRKLSFHRTAGQPVSQTNQIYILSLSNSFGIQAWNSYSNGFPRDLRMIAAVDVSITLSNETGIIVNQPDGQPVSRRFPVGAVQNLPANAWSGFTSFQTNASFVVPLITNTTTLAPAAYLHDPGVPGGQFVQLTANAWDPPNIFLNPQWFLSVRSRVRFILVDTLVNRIVDYVNLDQIEPTLDFIGLLKGDAFCGSDWGWSDPNPGILWCTNRTNHLANLPTPDDPAIPTVGVWSQLEISMGLPVTVSDVFWRQYNASVIDKQQGIRTFLDRLFNNNGGPDTLDFLAPFSPARTLYQYVRWEANDPLVHRLVIDLNDGLGSPDSLELDVHDRSPLKRLSGKNALADHYRPWGGNPNNPIETPVFPTKYNPAVKDPLVRKSDDWDFPNAEPLSFSMLGRIHRGTPWQTLYLKSADFPIGGWSRWLGNTNLNDALVSRPIRDRRIVSLLEPLLNTNRPLSRLSINNPDTNAWLAALDGLIAMTNLPTAEVVISSNSPQAYAIAAAIAKERIAQANRFFPALGDILSSPQLSLASPWLNISSYNDFPSDVVCEKIPSQLLSLLRSDSVGAIAGSTPGAPLIQFSGFDGYPYAIQSSTNLVDWNGMGVFYPTNGIIVLPLSGQGILRAYRSVLLP